MPPDHLQGLDIDHKMPIGAVQLAVTGRCTDDELSAISHKDGLSNLAV